MANIQAGAGGDTFKRIVTESGAAKDISAATLPQIWLYSPAGSGGYTAKTATFTTDGSDGSVQFTIAETDFIAGKWEDRVKYTLSGSTKLTERGEFTVDD